MSVKAVIGAMRVPFLLLTPVCVFLGASLVWNEVTQDWGKLGWVLLAAMGAHISVNTLNEYFDFKSGLDLKTVKTPFSGGSGSLPAEPQAAFAVLITGVISLLITIFAGLLLVNSSHLNLLIIGMLGAFIIIAYTPILNKIPLACLVAPGIGFGLIMVLGTALSFTAQVQTHWVLMALIPFCLVNNLLLLNQFPDLEADRSFGRNHLIIKHGEKAGVSVYFISSIVTVLSLLILIGVGELSLWGLLVLLPLSLSFVAWTGLKKWTTQIGEQPQFMALNVMSNLLTPTVLGLVVIFE